MADQAVSHRPPQITRWICLALVFALTATMAIRQLNFVNRYATNVMCTDQWEIYPPIFAHAGLWKLFTFQHGPHRQGVGFLITPLLAKWSDCNTRWDSFSISWTMIISSILAIFLSLRCGVRHPSALLPVPFLYLGLRQFESFVAGSNLAHGAMPILLFTTLCLCWFIPNNPTRTALISLLTFSLIFTGFGLFVGLLTPLLFSLEALQACRQNQSSHTCIALIGLLACGISWYLFSIGYVFDPANPTFHFPGEHPIEYFYFVAMMLVNFFSSVDQQPWVLPLGFALMLSILTICSIHAARAIRHGVLNQRPSVVIFLFSAFALIFCFNTAIGRVSLDWHTASLASRYVILMIPAAMAIFLHLATIKSQLYSVALPVLFAVLIAPGATQLSPSEYDIINILYNGKIAWRNACLATHNEERANEIANFQVYPRVGIIKDSLSYIDIHHLNFFKDAPPPPTTNQQR